MTTRHPLLCTLESEKANKIKLEKCIKSQKKSDTLIMGGESRLGGSEKILNEIQAFYRPSTYIKKSWCGNTRTLKALQAHRFSRHYSEPLLRYLSRDRCNVNARGKVRR